MIQFIIQSTEAQKLLDKARSKKRSKNSLGFTLVETLVAIAILMVAIAGPLTVANQALTAALGARNTMIAYNLAQDGMESIKNLKDNIISEPGLKPGFWSIYIGSNNCNSTNHCQIPTPWTSGNALNKGNISTCSVNPYAQCQEYIDQTGAYTYSSSGRMTPFTRYYFLTTSPSNTNDILVTVVVDWTDSSIPNEVKLQEVMSRIQR